MTQKEPSSWAEYVQAVDHDRKTLPWDPEKVAPVQRVSRYHVSSTPRYSQIMADFRCSANELNEN